MNDYELLYLIHQGSEEAMELLLHKYERLVWSCIHSYHYCDDSDHSEVYQRCLLCFHRAVERFREGTEARFSTYLKKLLNREIIDYIRRYRSIQKYNEIHALSLNQSVHEEEAIYLIDCVENNQPTFEGHWVVQYQNLEQQWQNMKQQMNVLECEIWDLWTNGYSYQLIGETLGITRKKVDNTLQKIRKKNKRLFDYEGTL